MRWVLVVIEFFQLALLYTVYEDWDLVGVELADHLGLFTAVFALHLFYIVMRYFDMKAMGMQMGWENMGKMGEEKWS